MWKIEVHVWKCCYDKPLCGLCDLEFEDLENLEIHLITCETYECGGCRKRFKQLSEIKKHMEDKHTDFMWHMKMDREDQNKLDYKKHFIYQI